MQACHRVSVGRIALRQHDGAAGIWPQGEGTGAARGRLGHPVHAAMTAAGEEFRQAASAYRIVAQRSDADVIEAFGPRPCLQILGEPAHA